MKKILNLLLKKAVILIVVVFIFACSAAQTSKNDSIEIDNISVSMAEDSAPKEYADQVNLALTGIMSENNPDQEVEYNWFIEFLKLDIKDDKSVSFKSIKNDSELQLKKTSSNYFIEISNSNPLNALLSVYNIGFYKITLQASKASEIKENSIIVKIGNPALPHLFIKTNIPQTKESNKNNFKGKYYLKYDNNIIKLNAEDVKDIWYDTKIEINPFSSFNIEALTHLVTPNKDQDEANIKENDNIKYIIDNEENVITINPVVLNNIQSNKIIIKKSNKIAWNEGDFYVSFLIWQKADSTSDRFQYIEKTINETNKSISINLNNVYLAKIFAGSFGFKPETNDYFIYFGPEGTNINELDPNNGRDVPALPFGYLLGKLGEDGKIFALGKNFTYDTKELGNVLSF